MKQNLPEASPSEDIPIGAIKRLIRCNRGGGSPYLLLGEQGGIRCVAEMIPCVHGAWIHVRGALVTAVTADESI